MNNQLVKKGYNKVAQEYANSRNQFKNDKYLYRLVKFLGSNSVVLDVGCGSGHLAKYLVLNGLTVIGIDISEEQIRLAKKNVPQGHFSVKDMSNLFYAQFNVHAIVCFYALFHTKREEHQTILNKFSSFLQSGGLLLITMGGSEWEGVEPFLNETPMFWSHYGPEKNRQMVEQAGFEILLDEIDESGGEKHQVIFARKI